MQRQIGHGLLTNLCLYEQLVLLDVLALLQAPLYHDAHHEKILKIKLNISIPTPKISTLNMGEEGGRGREKNGGRGVRHLPETSSSTTDSINSILDEETCISNN